jgi:hypothetical protein
MAVTLRHRPYRPHFLNPPLTLVAQEWELLRGSIFVV